MFILFIMIFVAFYCNYYNTANKRIEKIENGLDDCPDLDNDKTAEEWPDFFNVDY